MELQQEANRIHWEFLMQDGGIYRSLFHQSRDPILLTDEAGSIFDANQAACKLFGYSYADLMKINFSELKPPDSADEIPLLAGKSSSKPIEMTIKSRSHVIPVEATITPIKVEQTSVYLFILRDITERKYIEKILARQGHILTIMTGQMEDMVYYKDSNFRYIFCSKPYSERVLKCPQKMCIGKTDAQIAPLTSPAVYIDGIGEVLIDSDRLTKDKGTPSTYTEVITVDGRKIYFEVSKTPIFDKDGRFAGIVGCSRDITERKKAEQKMAEQQSLLRCLVDSIPAAVYLKDRDHRYLAVNKAFTDMIGKPSEDIFAQGKRDEDFFPKADAEIYRKNDSRVMETGVPIVNQEEPVITPQGETRWVMTTKVPYRDADDKIAGMVGIRLDITERKHTEEELRRRDDILQAVAFASESFLKSSDWESHVEEVLARLGQAAGVGRVYIFENKMEKTLIMNCRFRWVSAGLELPGNSLQLQKLSYREAGFERWEKVLGEGKVIYGHTRDFPPGERKILTLQGILSIVAVPIFDGERWWGFIGFDECLKERRWLPAEIDVLKAAADTMGAAIQRKYSEDSLRRAKEEAERANYTKTQFLANVSHEIRTPMNAIINLTDVVLMSGLTLAQQNHLTKVSASAKALLNILNDILDFSKIEAGRLEVEKKDFLLENILNDLIDLFGHQAATKGIEMVVGADSNVPNSLIGDPLRLKQILINLTGNAIKFTETGEISIRVSCPRLSDHMADLSFSVNDTGIGIAEENFEKLFVPFTQADGSSTRKYGGTGLGLAITKRLLEMMNGRILIESAPNAGSTFTVSIPFERQQDEADPMRYRIKEFQGAKVLIVDDSQVSRECLKGMLESWNIEVDTAASGPDALNKLNTSVSDGVRPFNLILADSVMPELDGFALSKHVRETLSLSHIPIILMTAFGNDREIKRGDEAGVNAYLLKPVKRSALMDTLSEVFRKTKIEGARPKAEDKGQPMIKTKPSEFHLPGIDIDAGIQRLRGNKTLFFRLLEQFAGNYAGHADAIRAAIQIGDIKQARLLAHSLKGVSGNISATDLHAAAMSLESAIAENQSKAIEDNLQLVESHLKTLINSVELMKNSAPPEPASKPSDSIPKLDITEITPVMIDFSRLLKEHNIDAESQFETLKKYLMSYESVEEETRKLEVQIGKYDFKEAQKIFQTIVATLGVSIP